MRVCMVAYTFYNADYRVRRYAEALAKRGDSVDMVVLQFGDQPKREVLNGVTVHRIQKRILNEKTKWSYLIRLSAFFVRSFLFISVNHLRKRYHLVHVHSVPDFEVFAALMPKLTGAKIVLDIHDIVPEFYASKFGSSRDGLLFHMLVFVEKLSCMFANHVIIANHLWEDTLTGRSIKPEKCTAIINYPDTNMFKSQESRVTNEECFVLMYPGTLNKHQGVDIAIEAFSHIADIFPQTEFHIYGDGPELENLVTQARELGLQQRVIFNGLVTTDVVASKMCEANIGIVPKRAEEFSDKAFSTKTMEFMVLGVPTIISDTTIDRYYFNEEVTKFFRSGDSEDLAKMMKSLIEDSDLRKEIAHSAFEFMKGNTWSVRKSIYIDLIDHLTTSKSIG